MNHNDVREYCDVLVAKYREESDESAVYPRLSGNLMALLAAVLTEESTHDTVINLMKNQIKEAA